MDVRISPSKLSGNVIVPPSKSLSHRAIIAACLADGVSKISNLIYSEDIIATIDAMKALGASVAMFDDFCIIKGAEPKRVLNVIDAHESGSTIRFLIPIALTTPGEITFIGRNNLVNRPLDVYTDIFEYQGIKYSKGEKELPLSVNGVLKSGNYQVRGDISSQFITGLLYALPMLEGDSTIEITTNMESKGYIDLTIDILSKFGIKIINEDYKLFKIKGNQKYTSCDYTVEGDYSQSAFFLVANALGADLKLLNMNKYSYQGDKKIIDDLKSFGVKVSFNESTIICSKSHLNAAKIDFSESPDLGPALTVLACLAPGKSEFINAERLRIKECDRISSMKEELDKLGANIIEHQDGMEITGIREFNGNKVLSSHNDHRVAMALAMTSLVIDDDIVIKDAECVKKSFPHFWKMFEELGGHISYEE